jgi:hypothetical protein
MIENVFEHDEGAVAKATHKLNPRFVVIPSPHPRPCPFEMAAGEI